MDLIIQLLSDWHLIIIFVVLLILFPVIFYLSSLDKSPVVIKKVNIPKERKQTEVSTKKYNTADNENDDQ